MQEDYIQRAKDILGLPPTKKKKNWLKAMLMWENIEFKKKGINTDKETNNKMKMPKTIKPFWAGYLIA